MPDQTPAPAEPRYPRELIDGMLYVVCPYEGAKCSRLVHDLFGRGWVDDYMSIHVRLHHKPWR